MFRLAAYVLPKSICWKVTSRLIGAYIMWVLILFYLTSANGSFAVHDFASQAACEHAREVAQGVRSPGLERVQAVCVPKQ